MLIGAASFTLNLHQIDIHLFPNLFGPHCRLVHVGLGDGFAFLHLEELVVGQWIPIPMMDFIKVHDWGPSADPPLPFPGIALQPGFLLAGPAAVLWVPGFVLGFGRRIEVTRIPPIPAPWHFIYVPHNRPHPHLEMVPDFAEDIAPFMRLQYGGQVQNWRSIF